MKLSNQKYIVLGLTPQGLAVLRVLGRVGADVTAFCKSKDNVGYRSKYGKKIVFKDINHLRSMITKICEEYENKPICYVTSGEVLALVLSSYKELYSQCIVSARPLEVLEMLSHKDKMYEYARNFNIRIAKYLTLDKYEDGCLEFPIFLKRNYEIPLFFKADKVEDSDALNFYLKRIPRDEYKNVIAQEYIDIKKKNAKYISCQGYYVDGDCQGILIAQQVRRLSKGLTAYIEEIKDPIIREKIQDFAIPFMKNLGYCGFAEFEFMLDASNGELFFMEVNTRTCGEQSSMHEKFKNIPEILLDPFSKIKLEPKIERIQWMNILRDIECRIQNRDFRHLGNIFHSKFDVFDIHDIRPFFSKIF